ncbi:MAG: metal ABC transporter substrate-binding protein, partial [Spirochaetaceae bacterium]|nr:metal ABC transporter substrate-binding protein [Spirochaetaceae bacterium]
TIFPPYDFTREIAGDKVNLTMLLPPAIETHSFQPTPRDIITIQNSDVFIYTGGESDEWIRWILASMDTGGIKIISLMDCVNPVEEEIVEGMQPEDDESGEELLISVGNDLSGEDKEYDEHVWTSVQNAKSIVQKISAVLCELDRKNADFYKENTRRYLAKLDDLDQAFQSVVDKGQRKTIVFGDRFPFRYFVDSYNLSYYAAFPGCSTETEPSAETVAFLINKIKAEHIPVIFFIELSNERMADMISEETGAKKLLLHASHNISKKDFENGESYYSLMTGNVESLKEALW